MRSRRILGTLVVVVVVVAGALWLERLPAGPAAPSPGRIIHGGPIRIGLVADGDMFDQHERFQHLADYVEARVGCAVELVTMRSLDGILETLADGEADAAWLDPMGAVLAAERLGARLAATPDDLDDAQATIFVRADDGASGPGDLAGRRVAARRGAATSELFLLAEIAHGRVPESVRIDWLANDEEVVVAVLEGRADAGCVERAHLPAEGVRTLAASGDLGDAALVVGAGPAAARAWGVVPVLLAMHQVREGQVVLEEFGVDRFLPGDADALAGAAALVHALDRPGVLGAPESAIRPAGTSD